MKTLLRKQIATLTLATIAMTTTVACSSQSTNGSASVNNGVTPLTNSAGQAMTNCSQSNANISDFSMNLESDPMSSTFAESNLIRIHFNAFPAAFNKAVSTLTVWAYGTDSNGNYTQLVQVPFTVEKYNGSQSFSTIDNNNYYALTWQQISDDAKANGISNASAATSLASMDLLVNVGNNPSATILEVALYSNGVGTQQAPASADRMLQALIPSFLANPNDYITTHNNTLLQLHPFYSLMGSGDSEAQFAQLGANLCF